MKTQNKSEYDIQAKAFLAKNGLRFRATLSDSKAPAWSDNGKHGHHYRVTISRAGGKFVPKDGLFNHSRLTFDFWGSIADAEKGEHPSAYDVLACISGDVHMCDHFEGFCDEMGYDRDSIKALQTFRRCSAFAKRLRAFFTEAELTELSEIR